MNILDLHTDIANIATNLLDIPSVSGEEKKIADTIFNTLSTYKNFEIFRNENTITAKTNFGLPKRIILAGHIDTVPLPKTPESKATIPSTRTKDTIYGRGATDMKAGVAVQLALIHSISKKLITPRFDTTFIFYDNEEVAAHLNGLGKLHDTNPELLQATCAILLEPSNSKFEAGCNGTIRAEIISTGVAVHSARAWKGKNAIHGLNEILQILATYQPQTVNVETLPYREGLNAVRIQGGIAGNVIPDFAKIEINYRFAPNKPLNEATQYLKNLFPKHKVTIIDASPGAKPNLDNTQIRELTQNLHTEIYPKQGWTDVARFSKLNIPAINFGPGNPLLAHSDNEHVNIKDIETCYKTLSSWLSNK